MVKYQICNSLLWHIAQPLFCTSETNTMLFVNCILNKIGKKIKIKLLKKNKTVVDIQIIAVETLMQWRLKVSYEF